MLAEVVCLMFSVKESSGLEVPEFLFLSLFSFLSSLKHISRAYFALAGLKQLSLRCQGSCPCSAKLSVGARGCSSAGCAEGAAERGGVMPPVQRDRQTDRHAEFNLFDQSRPCCFLGGVSQSPGLPVTGSCALCLEEAESHSSLAS